jgi:hypothetical protein
MYGYDWEQGIIKIPAPQMPRFRTEVVKIYNYNETHERDIACNAFHGLKALAKGQRNFDYIAALEETLPGSSSSAAALETAIWHTPRTAAALGLTWYNRTKLHYPGQRFEMFTIRNTDTLHRDGWRITFLRDIRMVCWDVVEGHSACAKAHDDRFVQSFFKLLDKVDWVRGTGGEILGNDTYNSLSRDPMQAEPYLLRKYGTYIVPRVLADEVSVTSNPAVYETAWGSR